MKPDHRALPSVDRLLQSPLIAPFIRTYGRELTLSAIRSTLSYLRQDIAQGSPVDFTLETIARRVEDTLKEWTSPSLVPVINATGVILHTNLGRAPLSRSALEAVQHTAQGYCNLEYDLESGKRGSRAIHAEQLLKRLTGAESALVVNNNAAAVLLALSTLASRRKVIIARSQLVEIGGGFRVPDIMRQSGARLIEVGTTNRVYLEDYRIPLQEGNVALVLRAHHSNFRIIGFTEEPALEHLVSLAHEFGVPVLDDLGSGALVDTQRYGLAHEPTVQESLKAGADLVCFSGDKLLGGPQAGILVGRREVIEKIRKHPLARAVRADKLCLAALTATLLHYLKDEWEREIPIWRMIATPLADIERRAMSWLENLGQGRILSGFSTVGGGSLPEETLPTRLLVLEIKTPERGLKLLRRQSPPIIARIEEDRLVLDPRTVLPEQDDVLLDRLRYVLSHL